MLVYLFTYSHRFRFMCDVVFFTQRPAIIVRCNVNDNDFFLPNVPTPDVTLTATTSISREVTMHVHKCPKQKIPCSHDYNHNCNKCKTQLWNKTTNIRHTVRIKLNSAVMFNQNAHCFFKLKCFKSGKYCYIYYSQSLAQDPTYGHPLRLKFPIQVIIINQNSTLIVIPLSKHSKPSEQCYFLLSLVWHKATSIGHPAILYLKKQSWLSPDICVP